MSDAARSDAAALRELSLHESSLGSGALALTRRSEPDTERCGPSHSSPPQRESPWPRCDHLLRPHRVRTAEGRVGAEASSLSTIDTITITTAVTINASAVQLNTCRARSPGRRLRSAGTATRSPDSAVTSPGDACSPRLALDGSGGVESRVTVLGQGSWGRGSLASDVVHRRRRQIARSETTPLHTTS